ncbi:hypothetical protein [Hyphomonas sp.]|uniref:hypothetical protein n=1 Tax=Hyphomonas sp. TaxID=87 RepID=UPI003918C4A4
MDMRPFTISNALTHAFWTPSPRGSLLVFAAAYVAGSMAMQLVGLFTQSEVYALYLRAFVDGGGDFTPYLDDLEDVSGQSNLASLLLMPLGFLVWVVFEGASQRRYIRWEGFRLRLGADEGRLAVVGLIWFALIMGASIAGVIAIFVSFGIGALIGGITAGSGLALVATLVFGAGMVWVFARLSPASALTIRDQNIRFFEAWSATKVCATPLFLSYLALAAMITILYFAAMFVMLVMAILLLGPAATGDGANAGTILAAIGQPGFWVPMGIALIALSFAGAVITHVFAGPAALAAKTDPNWIGEEGVPGAFS